MVAEHKQSPVDAATKRLIDWFRVLALVNNGNMPAFSNDDAIAAVYEGDLAKYARAHGNVQSRIDFACYRCNLPPLGMTADAPFKKAWTQDDRDWAFPVRDMQAVAQTRQWTDEEFDNILKEVSALPGRADMSWLPALATVPGSIREWAESFSSTTASPRTVASPEPCARIDWTRDELILALDLYLRNRERAPDDKDPEVVELSEFLNRMGAVLGVASGAKFRNANGVAMKLMNFRRIDPEFTQEGKKGLSRGNKNEQPVWDEYAHDPVKLAQVVAAIRATVNDPVERPDLTGDDEPEVQEAPEGKLLTRLHRARERSRKLVESCKSAALKKHGRLFCVGCGFDFGQKYGSSLSHIIDCHHTKPVSTLAEGSKTNVQDLILLCANCHRVVHVSKNWLSLEQLKALLTRDRNNS